MNVGQFPLAERDVKCRVPSHSTLEKIRKKNVRKPEPSFDERPACKCECEGDVNVGQFPLAERDVKCRVPSHSRLVFFRKKNVRKPAPSFDERPACKCECKGDVNVKCEVPSAVEEG